MITGIVLSVIFVAVTAVITAFLILGIRLKLYFDLETGTFVADVFAFGNVHAIKYKAFECNGDFYGQLNSRDLKKISLNKSEHSHNQTSSENEDCDGENKADIKNAYFGSAVGKINALTHWLSTLKKLKLKTLRAYLTIGTGNSMATSLVVSAIATLSGALAIATADKISAKNADIAVYPNFRNENTVFTLDVETGAGLARLLIAVTSLAVKMRREKKTADRLYKAENRAEQ